MAVERHTEYETIYILRTNAGEDLVAKAKERVEGVLKEAGGEVVRFDDWGARKLAYEIRDAGEGTNHKRGVYHYCRYVAPHATVAEVERNLRLADGVLKFMTVKLAEDLLPGQQSETPTFAPAPQSLPPERRPRTEESTPAAAPAEAKPEAKVEAKPEAPSKEEAPAAATESAPAEAEASKGEE